MKAKKLQTIDWDGKILRTHRHQWAGWQYAHTVGQATLCADGKQVYLGTTYDVVRGAINVDQILEPHNHRVLPNGTIATKCIDGHEEITSAGNAYYEVLYVDRR